LSARGDDLFKSSDYRISPFELESALLEHPCVAEAAIVPSPDPVRLSVPKAFVVLKPGFTPSNDLARDLFGFSCEGGAEDWLQPASATGIPTRRPMPGCFA
jgi:acetyl-CoA synthetase